MPRNHPPEKENMQKENMQNFKDPVSLYGVGSTGRCPGWTCSAGLEGHSCGNYCCRGGRWLQNGPCTTNYCPGWTCKQENQTCTAGSGYCCKGGRWRPGRCPTDRRHKGSWVGPRGHREIPSCNLTGHAAQRVYRCSFKHTKEDWGSCYQIADRKAFVSNPRPVWRNTTESQCLHGASKTNNYRTKDEIRRGISYSGGARQWIQTTPWWRPWNVRGNCYIYDHAEKCR